MRTAETLTLLALLNLTAGPAEAQLGPARGLNFQPVGRDHGDLRRLASSGEFTSTDEENTVNEEYQTHENAEAGLAEAFDADIEMLSRKSPKGTKSPNASGSKGAKSPKGTKSPNASGSKGAKSPKGTKSPNASGSKGAKSPKGTKSPKASGAKSPKGTKSPKA